jgi:alpha-beta hydrolase superfamily lysophospholipase
MNYWLYSAGLRHGRTALFLLANIGLLFFACDELLAQQSRSWQPDILGDGFEQLTLQMPDDYEGEVVVTVVRSLPDLETSRAVLYVHGYNDYFFQKEMAERFNERDYAFYAVDLRKYGRSWREHQRRTNVRDLHEYFADIDTALAVISESGYGPVLLSGHSTGGLTAALYADERSGSGSFSALYLNSPFFEFNSGFFMRRIAIPVVSWLGRSNPDREIGGGEPSLYGRSIHKSMDGEWDFDTQWKTLESEPVTYGWLRAIRKGHQQVRDGLSISVPVLVMHSDRTIDESEWSDEFFKGDAVLNVDHIRDRAAEIKSPDLRILSIEGGLHDLVLSRQPVREEVYQRLFEWLEEVLE